MKGGRGASACFAGRKRASSGEGSGGGGGASSADAVSPHTRAASNSIGMSSRRLGPRKLQARPPCSRPATPTSPTGGLRSWLPGELLLAGRDRKSPRLNSSHVRTSYAVFCLKKKNPNTLRP